MKPVNRYIQIDIIEAQREESSSGIVLPEDYNPTKERYVAATVVACASDVRFRDMLQRGDIVVVDRGMIEEIVINKAKFNVVQDNYVIGIV